MKTTSQIFHDLNAKLLLVLIDNEPPEARGCVDPFDPIFYLPLKQINLCITKKK